MANNTAMKAVSNEMIALEGGAGNGRSGDMTNSKVIVPTAAEQDSSDDEMGVRHCFYDFCKQTILHGWHYLADLEHDAATPAAATFVTFTPVSSPLALTATPGLPATGPGQPLLLHHNNHNRSRSSSPASRSRSRSNSHHHVTLNARASGSGHANVSITHHHHCCSCRGHAAMDSSEAAGQVAVPGGASSAGQIFSEDKKAVVAERFLCCCPIQDSIPSAEAVEATNADPDDSRMR